MNYPQGKKINSKNYINYAHRGMSLEHDLNLSNLYYLDNDIAIIYKKPTPIKVVKVNYNKRINTKITEAYYETPSTTDYNGLYKGKYIDFEAKETKSKTSFNLNNIHTHQVKHLVNVKNQGGISFLIVRFTSINKTFILPSHKLESFLNNNKRKSIPLNYFLENSFEVKDSINPRIDYIKYINKMIEQEM